MYVLYPLLLLLAMCMYEEYWMDFYFLILYFFVSFVIDDGKNLSNVFLPAHLSSGDIQWGLLFLLGWP